MRHMKALIMTGAACSTQSGFALAMTLIMLLILTILGVTAVNMSTLQQKMAGNMQETQVAFQAAESAVREAEAWISAQDPVRPQIIGGTPACTTANSVCDLGIGDTIATQNDNWWVVNAREFGAIKGNPGNPPELVQQGSRDPRYVIEYIQFVPYDPSITPNYQTSPGSMYFRITAHGWGNTPSARALLQTTFVKHYN